MTLKSWKISSKLAAGGEPEAGTAKKLKSVFTISGAHAKDINSIGLAPNDKFIVTGSQDKTGERSCLGGPLSFNRTTPWYNRDIARAPSYAYVASVSYVCSEIMIIGFIFSAKLWSREDGKLLGVFTGHRRGIWCVKFSPVDQIIGEQQKADPLSISRRGNQARIAVISKYFGPEDPLYQC